MTFQPLIFFFCRETSFSSLHTWNNNCCLTLKQKLQIGFDYFCLWQLEILEGKISWMSTVREGSFIRAHITDFPRALKLLVLICLASDFLPPGNIKLPSVFGWNTARDVCASQTLTWLHCWICFLATDLRRSDYTLETVGPAIGTEMKRSTKEADDADEPSEYDTQLWSREPMCLRAWKSTPHHCQGFVQNHKVQVAKCSICLPLLHPIDKEWKKLTSFTPLPCSCAGLSCTDE